jgi:hypothetical protein
METIKSWGSNLRVFLAWLVGFGMALTFLALFHDVVMVFIVNTLHWQKYVVRFTNMAYYFPAGLAAIAYFVLIYAYFSRSHRRGLLLRNVMLVFGIQLLSIVLAQLILLAYGYYSMDVLFTLLMAAELVGGAVLILLALKIPNVKTT